MKVVFPFAGRPTIMGDCLASAVLAAAYAEVPLRTVDVSEGGEDGDAYWRLLAELWASGDDFAIVEHDNEIHETALAELRDCEQPWCVFPYEGSQPIWGGRGARALNVFRCALGCTRFRGELTRAHPKVVQDFRLHQWRRLDSQLASSLHRKHCKAHEHFPMVKHHHDYSKERSRQAHDHRRLQTRR